MKVSEVMQKNVVSVLADTPLSKASNLIFHKRVTSLPVVDKQNRIVGILVEKDVLHFLFPTQKEFIEDYNGKFDFEILEDRATGLTKKKVGDLMQKSPVVILADQPIMKAASVMLLRRLSVLPVVDEDKKLLGIISHADVFKKLLKKLLRKRVKA